MKVLFINGSPHEHGCTYTAMHEAADVFEKNGIETEFKWLGKTPVGDCMVCGGCGKTNRCVLNSDPVNEILDAAESADGFIFGSPVYYAHPTGRILSALDRLFIAGGKYFAHKPGAAVCSARRGGTTATFDVINKYFTINQMPVVSSTYWNMVHGSCPEDVKKDLEGLQTMRNLAENMTWLLKCIELGKEQGITAPEADKSNKTNFIR